MPAGKRRTVAIVTGSRASYGIYVPVIEAIAKRKDLDYFLVVTGMHLMREFGGTIQEIKRDGWKIGAAVDMEWKKDSLAGQAKAIGRALIGFTDVFERKKPDIVLVQGDRGETIAAAIAASHLNIPVAHMHGGEINHTIDESNRHATTKYAHIHFPSTKKSRDRIIKMGERKEMVFLAGAAGIDGLPGKRLPKKSALAKKYGFDPSKPYALVIQHPCSGETAQSGAQMGETLAAVKASGLQAVVIYSNSDAGYGPMIREIKKAAKESKGIFAFPNVEHGDYLGLMKYAAVMAGNSSGAVLEAPAFGLPAVNIGTRQDRRESAGNIINAGYKRGEILAGIKKALSDKKFLAKAAGARSPYNPFGTADAGGRIAAVLAKVKIDGKLLMKQISY